MSPPQPLSPCTGSDPVKRAYEYLNQVRAQFLYDREVYDAFVELMRRFKEQTRVSTFYLYSGRTYISLDIQFGTHGSDGTGGRAFCGTSSPPEWL